MEYVKINKNILMTFIIILIGSLFVSMVLVFICEAQHSTIESQQELIRDLEHQLNVIYD